MVRVPEQLPDAVVNSLRRVLCSQRFGYRMHRFWGGFPIESCSVRQDDGVNIGMRQIERASEDVADVVVDGHANRPKHGSRQPRSVKRIRARVEVCWFADDYRQ